MKNLQELQSEFNSPKEQENRRWMSKRPFWGKEYYENKIQKYLGRLSGAYTNMDTTENFDYEVWHCHRMILIYQEALDTLARLERGESVNFVRAY